MTDELNLLRSMRPQVDDPDPELVLQERSALVALVRRNGTSVSQPDAGPAGGVRGRLRRALRGVVGSRRQARSRRWKLGVAGLLVGVAAGWSWAALRGDPAASSWIMCSDVAEIRPATGDPVADCAAVWEEQRGEPAPALGAFTDDSGGVWVLRVDDVTGEPTCEEMASCDDLVPLSDAFEVEVRVAELEDELEDWGRGLPSGCFVPSGARAYVTSQLERLELPDWEVTIDPPGEGEPDPGPQDCAMWFGFVEPSEEQVAIRAYALEDDEPQLPDVRVLADRLYDLMVTGPDARCMTLGEAEETAGQEASSLSLDHVEINTYEAAPDGEATCVRPTVFVGGSIFVNLREIPADHNH